MHPLQAVLALIATLALSNMALEAWRMGLATRPYALGMTAAALLGWWLLLDYLLAVVRSNREH